MWPVPGTLEMRKVPVDATRVTQNRREIMGLDNTKGFTAVAEWMDLPRKPFSSTITFLIIVIFAIPISGYLLSFKSYLSAELLRFALIRKTFFRN